MWFLTHVGIDRYNGKEIKHYKLKEGDRELDPLLNINWTYLDKTGTLLVTGKQGRIFRYDSGHDRFVQIYSMYNYWNKDYHAFVRYSYIDQESNVWLCGKSAIHLFNIESGQKQRISNRLGNITCIEQINSEHFFYRYRQKNLSGKTGKREFERTLLRQTGNDGYARTRIISTPYSQQTIYRHF